jgi:hypothetical protein
MRYFIFLLAFIILTGCRPSRPTSIGLTFGDGDTILKEVLKPVLAAHKAESDEIAWSGGSSGDEFSVRDWLTVKDANIATVAAKLSTEIDKLPAKRGWPGGHGSGASGDSYLRIDYEEDGAHFFFDWILFQKEDDVEVLILHKGVKR